MICTCSSIFLCGACAWKLDVSSLAMNRKPMYRSIRETCLRVTRRFVRERMVDATCANRDRIAWSFVAAEARDCIHDAGDWGGSRASSGTAHVGHERADRHGELEP